MITMTDQEMFTKQSRRFLVWIQRFFFVTGAFALCYVALTLLNARLFQKAASDSLEQQIHAEEHLKASVPRLAAREGDVLGRIAIPRLGLKVAILQGTTSRTLRLGAGHIEGTALPGGSGNIGIAGHRDTFFRGLRGVRAGDEIQIQTPAGLSHYKVDWVQITAPNDTGILSITSGSSLTLVTCFPFSFIGSAPERYVVHAGLADSK